jgi:hypothetical protein
MNVRALRRVVERAKRQVENMNVFDMGETQRDLLKLQAEANRPQEVPVGETVSA